MPATPIPSPSAGPRPPTTSSHRSLGSAAAPSTSKPNVHRNFKIGTLVIIPAQPSAYDVREARKTAGVIQQAADLVQQDIPTRVDLPHASSAAESSRPFAGPIRKGRPANLARRTGAKNRLPDDDLHGRAPVDSRPSWGRGFERRRLSRGRSRSDRPQPWSASPARSGPREPEAACPTRPGRRRSFP